MPNVMECNAPEPAEASVAIQTLNDQYIAASRTNDASWFRDHMAHDVLVILGSGRRMDKSAFLTMLVKEPKAFRSLTVRDVSVRVFGPTVQVDADAPWELADGHTGVSRYIDTYMWREGRWQVISAQVTWLPESGKR